MCGLFAYHSTEKVIDKSILSKGLSLLEHRGPDQFGTWYDGAGKVGLGQTRLKINDLSDIPLPMSAANDQVKVIANAEIYNFRELRADLIQRGHRFKTASDIEVLPYLYLEYGINFINKLRGEFAFIIWDERQNALFAVRDRFGIKPLYYTMQDNTLYFSSELPPLLKLGISTPKWNYQTLYDYTHLSLPYDKTLFQNIHKVAPAHVLSLQNGRLNSQAYWDINYQSDYKLSEAEVIESVREKLYESTQIRLQSDVPVACYLSGGIDSSALTGMTADIQGADDTKAFTIAFDNPRVDESPFAKRTAEYLGISLQTLNVTEKDILESFNDVVKHTCFPMPNTAGVARYLLSQYAKQGQFKAVLSGEGADEVFLGYWGAMIEASEDPRLKAHYSLSDEEKSALQRQLPVNRSPECFPKALSEFSSPIGHIPSWFTTQGYFNAKHRSLLNEDITQSFDHYSPYVNLLNELNVQNRLESYDNVQKSSYTWIKSFFPNTMLNWIGDRAEMANSIEARQPFLDHELFELMARVPTEMKIKNGTEKYILREAVKPFVTDELYQRKKFMFQAPPLKTVEDSILYQHIKTIILEGINAVPMYDKKKVLGAIELAKKAMDMPLHVKAELSYTLTSIASMIILSDHYQLS